MSLGQDEAHFLVNLNGLGFTALEKTASGGELSRISLAMTVVLNEVTTLSSLVYDEIDAGIGGEVANQIGSYLYNLSKKHQIICITHLAQIAAFATHHLCVQKKNDKGPSIMIKELNKQEKEYEIARMISGEKHIATSLQHAKNLLNQTRNA